MKKQEPTPKQRRHRETLVFGQTVRLTPTRSRPDAKRRARKTAHESRRRNRP